MAGVRTVRGGELERETAREGGGRREEGMPFHYSPRAPKFPLPLLPPATQARKKCVARAKFFFLANKTY